jgi:hypothetical protein
MMDVQILRALNASLKAERFSLASVNAVIQQADAFAATCFSIAGKPLRRNDLLTYVRLQPQANLLSPPCSV